MKKIIVSATSLILMLGAVSVSRIGMDYHIGKPAFALCTSDSIKNDCCAKFEKVLYGDIVVKNQEDRENKAMAEFRRCLTSDIGCSVEMTEMKSKSIRDIRNICE